jgi:hypothetical protein
MAIDPRGVYDLMVERLVEALESYRDLQSAIEPGVTFRVYAGNFRPQQAIKVPIVSVALSGLRSANETSRSREWELEAMYNIDIISSGRATQADRGDQRANSRLMYLIQQVLNGIYGSDRRAQVEAGDITLDWPNIQIVEPESFAEESPLIGARMTIAARMTYIPPVTDGEVMDQITVDASTWDGLYEYGG